MRESFVEESDIFFFGEETEPFEGKDQFMTFSFCFLLVSAYYFVD